MYSFPYLKTTLNIDQSTMRELKRRAAAERRTMSELVEAALRTYLNKREATSDLPALPTFRGGVPRVNIANRESLYDLMEDR